jgi:GNAT superfamily N-acetyltransferase
VLGVAVEMQWRGPVGNAEANALHAEAFGTRVFTADEWNWERLLADHSLGWVTARDGGTLVGLVNVLWDGLVHAWLQDLMVASSHRHRGIGKRLVDMATERAGAAGCEWLHVDFDDDLRPFYFDACGFTPTNAGLKRLPSAQAMEALPTSWAPERG